MERALSHPATKHCVTEKKKNSSLIAHMYLIAS